jgi:hypothetical protein
MAVINVTSGNAPKAERLRLIRRINFRFFPMV